MSYIHNGYLCIMTNYAGVISAYLISPSQTLTVLRWQKLLLKSRYNILRPINYSLGVGILGELGLPRTFS